MRQAIVAPPSLRRTFEETKYFETLSKNAQWVERARTPITFAELPSNPEEGWQVPLTDSNTAVWGATITATGANHVLAYFDGTNWTVMGK